MTDKHRSGHPAFDANLHQSGVGARTLSGSAVTTSFHVVRVLTQLVNSAVLARLLTPDDFGLFAIAMILISAATTVIEMGLALATTQRPTVDHELVSALFAINIGLGLAASLVVFGLSPLMAWLFGDERLAGLLMASAGILLVLAAGQQHSGLLTRTMRFRALHSAFLSSQILGTIAAITAAVAGMGYWSLVIGFWVGAISKTALLWIVSGWSPSAPRNLGQARSALAFGGHLTASRFLELTDQRADKGLVGWRWGATEAGFYSRAYTVLMMVTTLLEPLNSVMVAALSRLQNDHARWRAAFLDVQAVVCCVGFGAASILVCTAHPLLRLMYGPGWERTGDLFFLMSFSIFAVIPFKTLGWLFVSLGLTKQLLMWSAIKVSIVVAAVAIALPYGAEAVALAWSGTLLALYAPGLAFAARYAPLSTLDQVKASGPFILVGGVAVAATLFVLGASADTSGSFLDVAQHAAARGLICALIYGVGAVACLSLCPHYRRLRGRAKGWGAKAANWMSARVRAKP